VVSGQLEDSLRHEIESYMEGRLSAIRQEIVSLQSQLNESLTRLLERQGDVQMDGSVSASISEHLRAAHERGVELAAAESSRAKASSDMAIVKSSITEINEQQSQADILKALVNRAAAFAPRVAFFVVKDEQATGWRGRGFEGTVGDRSIQQITLPLSADTIIAGAVKSLATFSGGPSSHSEDHLLMNRLGEEVAQRTVAIPLTVRGRAVAVLYADSAGLDSESINLEALETLTRVSGMAVELLSISRTAPRRAASEPAAVREEPVAVHEERAAVREEPAAIQEERAPVQEEHAAPAYTPSREYEEAVTARDDQSHQSESAIHAEPFAPEPQPPATFAEQETVSYHPEPSPTPVEVAPAASGTRRRYGMDVELPVEVSSEEERRLHNDARRFARLLISEIKLYNEQKVSEGRSKSDLYDRLREYIDRSREMYDKRVKAEVASRYDYFHGELVNTLAEGDASKLGSNYPGATVTA
jgi:hypothetical protein